MKKIFTLLLSFMAVMAMAQAPVGVINQAASKPVIDGDVDAVWADANAYNVDQNFQQEVPTIGETTWKALYDDDGVFVLVEVADDEWYPGYEADTTEFWHFDQTEVYFDVNYLLEDGKGASGTNAGHIQVAPEPKSGLEDGTPTTTTDGVIYSYKVTGDASYVFECYIPFTKLLDAEGNEFAKGLEIGFDICVIDHDLGDPARKRAVWSNVGDINENYNNMNDAGRVTFEGAETTFLVDQITLNSGTITTDNGTLQMVATISPEYATNKKVKWSVTNDTGSATISADGLLTALKDGTVTVTAASTDGSQVEEYADIVISGQIITKKEVWNIHNLITNWNFDTDLTGWAGWIDEGNLEGEAARAWEDGIAVMTPAIYVANPTQHYHYQFNQNNIKVEKDASYVLRFKSWAGDDGALAAVDFESSSSITAANGGDQYGRIGTSTDTEATGGVSEWFYTINYEPAWYEFHVTFDNMLETTVPLLQFNFSQTNEKVYVDSVMLVTQEMWDAYPSMPSSSNKLESSVKVYPNPVGNANTLYVDLSSVNSKVAIYNSIGQKMMEKTANGKRATFDVSSLRKGMYFVKSEDGTTVKFIK